MQIKYVTLTGADESVEPMDLALLSDKYTFVEWGILFSQTRQGIEPRYPSYEWIEKLQG